MKTLRILIAALALMHCLSGPADAELSSVKLPLEEYNRLLEIARQNPGTMPSGFGRGQAVISLSVDQPTQAASVTAEVPLKILEDRWTFVPLLPTSAVIVSAMLGGQPVELISTPEGIFFGTNKAGAYRLVLEYQLPGVRANRGGTFSVPLPPSSGASLTAKLPASAKKPTIVPATAVEVFHEGDVVRVRANLPATSSFDLSFGETNETLVISRAIYRGTLSKDLVAWSGELRIENPSGEAQTAYLLPSTMTLREISLDGKPAPIFRETNERGDEYFATTVSGKGGHTIGVEFESPVAKPEGLEEIALTLAEVPVSRFELILPGTKEVKSSPEIPLTHERKDGTTKITAHAPLVRDLSFRWTESVPDEENVEVRAAAELYHRVHAEEGVLLLQTTALVSISRGEMDSIRFLVPVGFDIGRVTSRDVGIVDFRAEEPKDGQRVVQVYFDRKVKGDIRLELFTERGLAKDERELSVPMIHTSGLQREKGMLILISTKELAVVPEGEDAVARIGENQIPPAIREGIAGVVSHVFKLGEEAPTFRLKLTEPVKAQGKFDADVETLVSLSDVSVRVSSTVDIRVKSGALSEIALQLPDGVNLLSVNAPYLRNQQPVLDANHRVSLELTQDIEGEMRIEVAYERILPSDAKDLTVPQLHVAGAEVEQGRIGVEALSALELVPGGTEQLISVEPSQLPKAIVLKASHPLLLGFKYVRSEPEPVLRLNLQHHAPLDVASAVIDQATYRTLMLDGGLAVSSARFTMRNTTEQFLRVRLPIGVEVWSASVDGKAEKPALGEEDKKDGSREVLLKILSSAEPFNVELVYQSRAPELGVIGMLNAQLPRPTTTVTRTAWEIWLPNSIALGRAYGNIELVSRSRSFSGDFVAQLKQGGASRGFSIDVPQNGQVLRFEKLYANKTSRETKVSIGYTSSLVNALLYVLTAVMTIGTAQRARSALQTRTNALVVSSLVAVASLGAILAVWGTLPHVAVAVATTAVFFARSFIPLKRREAL